MIQLNHIQRFQLFCIETYKTAKGLSGKEVISVFYNKDVFSYLAMGYEVLHTQSKDYIIQEIELFVNSKK